MNSSAELRVQIECRTDAAERKRLNSELLRAMIDAADLRVGDIIGPAINRGPLQSGCFR